ncbi:MAG: carboxypeptidase regulatory-like domain-containing protein [Saprospiraceae bacterium]
MKNILTFILAIGSLITVFAQNQTIKGSVIDKQAEISLVGASVELLDNNDLSFIKGTVTDADGTFSIPEVNPGRHTLRVSYIGYLTATLPNIVVTAGKQVVLDIKIEESAEVLDEVVVTAKVDKDRTINDMAAVSARQFSLEEVNRYSGGRGDVARLVGNFAGVSTADDSRNDIVIRGNSPTGVLWRLEGIPIPNPNHFSTLGTTGGPVSAMNPNMLSNSDFMTSAFPSEYGNALAGVFDLGLRSGNKDKTEYMVQMGAISGLETMIEGPMLKNGSFVVAGRYSFVGFASELGLPIGTNATPDYKDITFKLDFGGKKNKWSLFGIGGQSDITFLHNEVDENDLFADSDEDSGAESLFGVGGLKHNYLINDRTYIKTVLAVSTSQNSFYVERIDGLDTENESNFRIFDNKNVDYRTTLSSYINRKFNAKTTLRAGFVAERYDFDLSFQDREDTPDVDGDGVADWVPIYESKDNTYILQPFVQTQYKFNNKWVLNMGLHGQFASINNKAAIEPRASISHKLSQKNELTFGYGLHNQSQPLPMLLLQEEVQPGVFKETNKDLDFTGSHHFVLGLNSNLAQDWRLKTELYYQSIFNVPVESVPGSFSMLNVGADFGFPTDKTSLLSTGSGQNYGLELTLEKFYSKGYYALLTGSVYQSKYTGSDEIERNTAFNNRYVLNALFGKEWGLGKSKRNMFSIDTKLTHAGGRPYTPVDLPASIAKGSEVRNANLAFSENYPGYLRWDVKFGFRFNNKKKKLSQQIYFDLQNVMNRQNLFIKRYNDRTQMVNNVYQSGLFPDFVYRIQF